MKTVVAYLSGVPSAHKSPHKIEVLRRFITGVNKVADRGIAHAGNNLISADVGVIQGWVHDDSPSSPHLTIRKKVSNNTHNKHTIIVDSNLFNYVDKTSNYYRYSMDGIFPTTGNYFCDSIDENRWKQISKDLNISLKDWRTTGNHILVCTQRNGGWSMKGKPVTEWLDYIVEEIRKYSDRPIIVRGHPGDKNAKNYLKDRPGKYTVSRNPSILQDFKNAWAMVNYNSTPAVAASIEGIPAFITDPTPQTSQAYGVANTDLKKLETPELNNRQQWIEKISMCHWNYNELETGYAWKHMRKYI